MVRTITFTAALALLGTASARAQLDLTPKESFYEVEGIRVPNVAFRNGSKKVAYTPPPQWALSGGGNKLILTPPNKAQAGATIENAVAPVPLPEANTATAKSYGEMALKLAPPGASKVEVVEAVVCPMTISNKSMIDVTLSYIFYGQPFRMNVLIMPRGREQLRFQLSARAGDYAALAKEFRDSLFSLQGL